MTQLFSAWAIDYIVNLLEMEEGYRYLLLMVDTFTKWVELIPMHLKLSSEVAAALKLHIIACFGIPLEIHCDRGLEFAGEVRTLCEEYRIQRKTISTQHP